MSRPLKQAEMIRVSTWINNNKNILLQHTRAEIQRRIKADTGIQASIDSIAAFEEAVGVTRNRGNAGGGRKDRSSVIAKHLVKLYDSLELKYDTDLADIAAGK